MTRPGKLVAGFALVLPLCARAEISAVCAPERTVVRKGESVQLRVWVTDSEGKPLPAPAKLQWRASGGSISGGERAVWTLKDIKAPSPGGGGTLPGATATVEVDAAERGQTKCAVEVLVEPDEPQGEGEVQRSARLSARLFLLPHVVEPLDYGLCSYLIFSTPPKDDSDRDRFRRAIEAYLRVLVPAEDLLSRNVRVSRVNVTMLPVAQKVDLSSKLKSEAGTKSLIDEILTAYDYGRARLLLADLGAGTVGGGPYLIARETRSQGASQTKLLVDMTGVSPSLIWDWMTWFCWLTSQERSWGEVAVSRLGLNLRNLIAVTGSTAPVVLTAMTQWVYVLKRR